MTDKPVEAWQRPPFEPNNELAVKHGAYSARRVAPVAQSLIDSVLADPDVTFLHRAYTRPALAAWAEAEARVILIQAWVDEMSIQQAAESKNGQVSPLELLRRWETTALTHRKHLGLDPLSRARLGRDVAAAQVDVATLLTELREARDGGTPRGE